MKPDGRGGGAYSMQKLEKLMTIKNQVLQGNFNKLKVELLAKISILEEQVKTLLEGKGGLVAEVAVTAEKKLGDLKLVELKALALEKGIDDTDFGNRKANYVEALKKTGLE
jgi:hypothetical protein